ncbi:tetratricopeptide repeat protein [Hydrogenivirga sp.]
MREFIDIDRPVRERFEKVKGLFEEGRIGELKEELKKLIEEDPYYLEPYVLLNEIYEIEGRVREAEEILEEAYRRALELISEEGKLPDRLEWKHPTNRHIINALLNMGVFYWEVGEIDRALKIFKELYRMNPADEPGVRFYILALLEGMSLDEFEQVFSRDGEYDYEDLERWFTKHAPEHPEVFNPSR